VGHAHGHAKPRVSKPKLLPGPTDRGGGNGKKP
jgi:hypothetical protein